MLKTNTARSVWLSILLTAALLTGCGDTSAYAVTEPTLPEMAPYPNEQAYINPVTGEFDDEGFDAEYEAWSANNRLRQNLPEDYQAGLLTMTQATASVFLTGTEENAVYAPLNTYLALGMLAEITDGQGREQVLDVLGAPDLETLRTRAKALWQATYNDDGAQTTILSSSLWLHEDVPYRMETLEALRDTYYAAAYQGEMGTEKYDKAMQNWLNEKTGGMLEEAVAGVQTSPQTVLTLLSTVYYQAKWQDTFSEANNTERTFRGTAGDVTCTFMKQTDSHGTFYGHEDFSAIRRGMETGGDMWFILPDEGVTTDAVLQSEDMYTLFDSPYHWPEQKRLKIHQYIPKFDICADIDMNDGLRMLGITVPFDAALADYSPLTEAEEVFLGKARQATRVAIDEEGVTAASFVEMMLCGESLPPEEEIDFVLDRPFIFVVTGYDGVPLFIGVVNQP